MANKTFNDVKINVTFTKATSDVTVSGGNDHASNISGSPTAQDLALALGKIQNWYDNWHAVVWTGDAATVNGKTVAVSVPSTAKFTDHITTATTTGSGNAVTSVTADANGALTVTKGTTFLTSATQYIKSIESSGSGNAVTALSVSGGTLTYTLGSTFLTEHPAITVDTDTTSTASPGAGGTFTTVDSVTRDTNGHVTKINTKTVTLPAAISDTKVTQSIKTDNKNYPLLLSYYESSSSTTTAQTANRSNSIYANPSTGTITATNFAGTINGYTISGNVAKAVPSNAVFTDTTYTFAEGSTNGKFTVTPSGGTAQSVTVHGLNSAAYQPTTAFVPAKPDGSTAFLGADNIVNSKYLPSYVDDVIEGYYHDGKFYTTRSGSSPNYTYSGEITGETGKIYVDLGVEPAEPYRWGGSAYTSMRFDYPTAVDAVDGGADIFPDTGAASDVVNGEILLHFTDGTTETKKVYKHPDTAGNKHIPSGGSSGQVLVYSSSGTAAWGAVPSHSHSNYQGATASAAGVAGFVPPAAKTQTTAYFLTGAATWSNAPVIESDILTLNVIAGS